MKLSHFLQVPSSTLLLAEVEARLSYSETLRVTSVLGKKDHTDSERPFWKSEN